MTVLLDLFRRWLNSGGRSDKEIDEMIAKEDAKYFHMMLAESWYEEMELEFPAMSDEMGDMDEQLASWMSVR